MDEKRFRVTAKEPTPDMIEAAYTLLTGRALDTPARARRAVYDVWKAMWPVSPPIRSTGLTPHQASIHNFLAEYIAAHGMSPNLSEIVAGTGVACRSNLAQPLRALEKMGVIKRRNQYTRNINLLVMPGEYVEPLFNRAGRKLRNQNRKTKTK